MGRHSEVGIEEGELGVWSERWWWMEGWGNERRLGETAAQQWVAGVKGLEMETSGEILAWDKFPRADVTRAQCKKQ